MVVGPTSMRRRTIHEVARIMAGRLGVPYIGDDYKRWVHNDAFVAQFKALSPHNYFSLERKFALKEFARSVKSLPGAVAECGSYVGVSAWFIANELRDSEFYLFDSFEGLSVPSEKDQSDDELPQWRSGSMASTETEARENLKEFQNVHLMKGWIPQRFNEVSHLRFKLLHIDVDLYEPTRDSLDFFYDRMVPGGIIVMDDYGFRNCPGAFLAANEFMENCPEEIIHLPTGQGVIIIKQRNLASIQRDDGLESESNRIAPADTGGSIDRSI